MSDDAVLEKMRIDFRRLCVKAECYDAPNVRCLGPPRKRCPIALAEEQIDRMQERLV
jgi:hypothetical protein